MEHAAKLTAPPPIVRFLPVDYLQTISEMQCIGRERIDIKRGKRRCKKRTVRRRKRRDGRKEGGGNRSAHSSCRGPESGMTSSSSRSVRGDRDDRRDDGQALLPTARRDSPRALLNEFHESHGKLRYLFSAGGAHTAFIQFHLSGNMEAHRVSRQVYRLGRLENFAQLRQFIRRITRGGTRTSDRSRRHVRRGGRRSRQLMHAAHVGGRGRSHVDR